MQFAKQMVIFIFFFQLYPQVSKLKILMHPFMPAIKVIFKKYLGQYIKESLKLDQFTKMGLKNLSIKEDAINQKIPPSFPLILSNGQIGLLKLDLKSFKLIVDEIHLLFTVKTKEQFIKYQENYTKSYVTEEKFLKFKEDFLKQYQDDQQQEEQLEDSSHNESIESSLKILKSMVQKINICISNVHIKIQFQEEDALQINIPEIQVNLGTIQKKQLKSQLFLNKIQLQYNDIDIGGIDKQIEIFLKMHLEQRLKYRSKIKIEDINFYFKKQYLSQLIQQLLSINSIQEIDDSTLYYDAGDQQQSQINTIGNVKIIHDYWNRVENDNNFQDSQIIEGDSFQIQQSQQQIETSQYCNQQPLQQSIISQSIQGSVFSQNNNLEQSQLETIQGDAEMEKGNTIFIFSFNKFITKIQDTENSIYELLIEKGEFKILKNDNKKLGIKKTPQLKISNIEVNQMIQEMYNFDKQVYDHAYHNRQPKEQINNSLLESQFIQEQQEDDNNEQYEDIMFETFREEESEYLDQKSQNMFYSCVEVVEQDQDFQDELTFIKAKHFNYKSTKYLSVYPIITFSKLERGRELIRCYNNDTFISYIHQFTKNQTDSEENFSIQLSQNEIKIEQIFIFLNQPQILFFQSLIPKPSKKNKQQWQTQQEQQDQIQLKLSINNIYAFLIVKQPNLIDFYFTQQIHNQNKHRNNNTFRYQLQLNLSKCYFHYLQININQLNQIAKKLFSFEQITGYHTSLDIYCVNKDNLEIDTWELFSIEKFRSIEPLIDMTKGMSIGIPLISYHFDYRQMMVLNQLKELFKQPKSNNEQQQSSSQSSFSVFFDQIIVEVYSKEPQKEEMEQYSLKTEKNIISPIFVLNQKLKNEKHIRIHLSKVLIKDAEIDVYNLVVVDRNRQGCNYGSPNGDCTKQQYLNIQELHFRDETYMAEQVIVYKQERNNREKFKNSVIYDHYLNGSDFQLQLEYQRAQNMVHIKGKQIRFQNSIVSLDTKLEQSIDVFRNIIKKQNSNKHQNQDQSQEELNIEFNLYNNWISVFPCYSKGLFIRDFIILNENLKYLEAEVEETYYYSWVRLLIDIEECKISIKKQKQYVIDTLINNIKLLIKCTSSPTLSIPNPILLLQYQDTIYKRNRKYSDAIQVDQFKEGVLDLYNFKTIATIPKVDITMKQDQTLQLSVNIDDVRLKLKKDSILALWDLQEILLYNSPQPTNNCFEETDPQNQTQNNQTFNIFSAEEQQVTKFKDDFIDEVKKTKSCSIQLNLKSFSIKLSSGQHFPTEIYTFLEEEEINQYTETYDNQNIGSIQGYETYHLKNQNPGLLFEIEKQKSTCKDHILMKLTNLQLEFAKGKNFAFQLSIDDFFIEDNLAISRYKYILAKESKSRLINDKINSDQIMKLMYIQKNKTEQDEMIPNISVNLMIYPIRVCIYGATFEFLYETYFLSSWKAQKKNYIEEKQKQYEIRMQQLEQGQNKKALLDIAHQEGYQPIFGNLSKQQKIYVQQIIISNTKITLSYDGSGIQVNQILKGMMRIAYQDNLELKLKQVNIEQKQFKNQKELFNLLQKAYSDYIKQNSELRNQLYVSFKAVQNVQNIYLGFKQMFSTMYDQGILVGISSGSIPVANALMDELLYLAKKPIDVCESVSDSIGLKPLSRSLIKPINQMVGRFGDQFNVNKIPKEFLKW